MSVLKKITLIDACDIPSPVEDYCIENGIWTSEHGIYPVEDDGNIFAEYLKDVGYDFSKESGFIAIMGY